MGVYGFSVVADAATTQRGLARGAEEANPLYSHLSDEAIPPARVAVGALVGFGLNSLHKERPRLAKTLAVIFTVINVGAAVHNYRAVDGEIQGGSDGRTNPRGCE